MAWVSERHPAYTPRRGKGLAGYEQALARAGLEPVAGIDEAGRGACAGPLVVAAVSLDPRRRSRLTGLADSKALTAPAREAAYDEVVASALAWHAVVIPPGDIDAIGLHVCNVSGMRRALAGLDCTPGYVLTDGFPVRGFPAPTLAMWQGDEVAACVAAASIIAKVTRDRIMRDLHPEYPEYGFARHKGYSTPSHMKALGEHGPCPEHRMSFANVIGVVRARSGLPAADVAALAGVEGDLPAADIADLAGRQGDDLAAGAGDTDGGEEGVPAADVGDLPDGERYLVAPAAAYRAGEGRKVSYG